MVVTKHGDKEETTYTQYGICESLGSLSFFKVSMLGSIFRFICCCKCESQTSDMAKSIGLGPTLFLMSTKALAIFFFVMTLVNIPYIMILYNQDHEGEHNNINDWWINKLETVFYKMSIGHMANLQGEEREYSCKNGGYASRPYWPINNPFDRCEPWDKDDFRKFLIRNEYIVMILFMWFIWTLEKAQNDYIQQFKDQTIEMDDFTIIVKRLPKD